MKVSCADCDVVLEDCLSLLDAVNSGGGPQAGQPTA